MTVKFRDAICVQLKYINIFYSLTLSLFKVQQFNMTIPNVLLISNLPNLLSLTLIYYQLYSQSNNIK